MEKVKITIRQLNGTLAALTAAKQIPELQKELEQTIAFMLEKKKYEVMMPKDSKMVQIILELNDINNGMLAVQKRRR